MQRRSFIKILGGGAIFAAAPTLSSCSSELPSEAIAAWQHPSNDLDVREWILSYALLAPHSHNLQSWLVDLKKPDEIVLYCDLQRLLPETDPLARQIVLSQGTFIEVLDLAAKERGYRAEINLFPQGEFGMEKVDKRPVASIILIKDDSIEKDPLFSQILKRHTNREAYEMRDPSADALTVIEQSVGSYPVKVGFTLSSQPDQIAKERDIAKEGWRIELTTPAKIMETYNVLRIGPDEIAKYRDGISINDPLLRFITAIGLFDRSKAPAADDPAISRQIEEFNEKIDKTAAFFWMISADNSRVTQINAGRAYVRAQLAATGQGLSMHPISQALQEFPEMQKLYAEIHQHLTASQPDQVVQMWTRLGYAPLVSPAPRRGLADHIIKA